LDRFRIREWTSSEWMAHEDQWARLLAQSGQDPLFLSWEWMTSWWRVFGIRPNHSLCLLAAYRDDELIGIAPLYRSTVNRRGLRMRSMQFIGHSSEDGSVVSSEYLDVLAEPSERDAVRAAFVEHLVKVGSWSEFVVSRSVNAEKWTAAFTTFLPRPLSYDRILDENRSHQADLSLGFESYRGKLGQSTRRSVWNLRRRVVASGVFEFVDEPHIEEAFAELNRLHQLRWNRPAFVAERLQFHLELASRFARQGELAMSRLLIDGKTVSVLFDVRKGTRQYNIKAGFDPDGAHGFSIGRIHFGYALEAAAEMGVTTYDFLAGRGFKTDYKVHLSQLGKDLKSVQILRGVALPLVFRCYDAYCKSRMRYRLHDAAMRAMRTMVPVVTGTLVPF
jgi:CelD/BcsL family acetyltransferase involved in cellulose biosynthesis